MDATVEWKAVARPVRNQCQTPDLIYRADVENEVNDETIYISDLLQQLLKNGSEIKSTESFASSRKATFNRIFWWHSVVKQNKWMY